MSPLFGLIGSALLAADAGISFLMQQAVNADLRAALGSPGWADFVSYLGGQGLPATNSGHPCDRRARARGLRHLPHPECLFDLYRPRTLLSAKALSAIQMYS
jgi:hypothetical protein